MKRQKAIQFWFPAALVTGVILVMLFPLLWFKKPTFEGVWVRGSTNVNGWHYDEIALTKAVENIITCDFATNGRFTNEHGNVVRVFLSSRVRQVENDLQLFAHPPDLCWRAAGFNRLDLSPSVRTVSVLGMDVRFERRLFEQGGHKELVYYAGLLSGLPLPFRLGWDDLPAEAKEVKGSETPGLRSLARIPETIKNRKTLAGAKQFIRISTPVELDDITRGDDLLEHFLKQWLQPDSIPTGDSGLPRNSSQ